jgi:hypothetical protein
MRLVQQRRRGVGGGELGGPGKCEQRVVRGDARVEQQQCPGAIGIEAGKSSV